MKNNSGMFAGRSSAASNHSDNIDIDDLLEDLQSLSSSPPVNKNPTPTNSSSYTSSLSQNTRNTINPSEPEPRRPTSFGIASMTSFAIAFVEYISNSSCYF
jgi:hypothetical protein